MANEVNRSKMLRSIASATRTLEVLLEPDDAPIRGTMLIQSQTTIL